MKTSKLLLIAIAAMSVAAATVAQTAPSLVVVEPVKDAGAVGVDATIEQTFTLRNQGAEEMRILSVEPDCGCTIVSFDRVIPPGGTGEVSARVDVSRFVGPIAKYIQVLTSDPANPQLALTIKAEVRPKVQVHPGYARFLTVEGTGELRAEQTVWASDQDDFEVVSARSPYPFLDVKVREATADQERPEGRGQQWAVVMTLSAQAPVGPLADHVRLATNHPDARNVRIPVSGFVRPVLAANPPAVDFGVRDVTKPIVASVLVKNFSEDEIALLSATSDLEMLDVQIVPKDRDHYVTLTLRPESFRGPFTSVLTVQTDSSRIPTLEIEIKGTVQ